MSTVPDAAEGGEEFVGPTLPKGLRLSDAESIATERLDGAAEGSLKEALATTPVEPPPAAGARLVDRVEAVRVHESFAVPPQIAPDPEPAGPATAAPTAAALPAAQEPSSPAQAAAQSTPARSEAADGVRPVADALGAAAQLAADATAAANALESLKRMLERQLPPLDGAPAPTSAALPPRPAPPAGPPPLPARAPASSSREVAPKPPAALAARAAPRRRLDVRGFLAGFALSGAVGVVLYLFMTAG